MQQWRVTIITTEGVSETIVLAPSRETATVTGIMETVTHGIIPEGVTLIMVGADGQPTEDVDAAIGGSIIIDESATSITVECLSN